MKEKWTALVFILIGSAGMSWFFVVHAENTVVRSPVAKVIGLTEEGKGYQRLLGGSPDSVTMHAGRVVLQSGETVGTHNTENYEEILIILHGSGEMVITGSAPLKLVTNSVAYCPPHTEHNVKNTGDCPLAYIYVASIAESGNEMP